MGVGGKFWDLLKPYARHEGPDFLFNKRVAVDLSYWIVQHETAVTNSYVRKPHLRLTFYRTINLFSKFGAFPVFVLDGTPSPLKSRARVQRFFRCSSLGAADDNGGVSVERNRAFLKCVQECVELLELFGMPIVKATGEAEALCAQLNHEGFVDACITADSDAFLYGANCVIKNLKPNTKEPFECYNMSDIEAGLGLKRKHLIAISLLVGNDHDLNGVQGIGLENALRLVCSFSEDEILDSLYEIGNGSASLFQASSVVVKNFMLSPDESSPKSKASHCSFCGHPGSKRGHFKFSCEYCSNNSSNSCTKKPEGFKCSCSSCDKDREEKEKQKLENWQIKICNKIASEPNFPNANIIDMYLRINHRDYASSDGNDFHLSWESPNTDMLVDFLVFHKLWDPSYVRQRLVPLLSTIYLRDMARNPEKSMLYGQYEFDSIKRIRTRYGHQSYVVKWKKAAYTVASVVPMTPVEESDIPEINGVDEEEEIIDVDEAVDEFGDSNASQIQIDDGHGFLLTDENKELVRGAFPDEVDRFLREKELKESKRRKASSAGSEGKPKGVQRSINHGDSFYKERITTSEFPPSQEKNYEASDMGVSVLVVDCDSTSLVIVSRMLHSCGYKVITAECASAAFRILQHQQDEIDLILTEFHLPDMDKYQFLERLGEISSLPIVILSADSDEKAMLGGHFKGAEFYLVKPITMNIIKNIWQFSYMNKRDQAIAAPETADNFNGESPPLNASATDTDCQSHSNTLKGKRKRQRDEVDKDESGDDLIVQKKQKLIWTNELHNRFLQVVGILGIDNAHPKKILQHMNVPGLKKEHISSHLQKYRLSLKRDQDASQNNMIRDYSPPSAYNSQAETFQHSMTACQPEIRCRFGSNNVISPAYSVPVLSSAHYPIHVDSDHNNMSMSSYGQLSSPTNKVYCNYGNSAGGFSSFDQMGDCTDVYVPSFVETSLTQQQQDLQDLLQLMLPPLSPILPEPEQDHDIFEADIGEIDDLIDTSKGSAHMFFDSLDFCDLW